MVWYVALIAVVNLGLGYALAVYLGVGGAQMLPVAADSIDETDYAVTELEA